MHFPHFFMPFPLKTCVPPKATQNHLKVKSTLCVREYAHFAHPHSWRNVARLKANCNRRVNAWHPATADDPTRKHVPQDSSRTGRLQSLVAGNNKPTRSIVSATFLRAVHEVRARQINHGVIGRARQHKGHFYSLHRNLPADFALFHFAKGNSAAPESCWMSKKRNHHTSVPRVAKKRKSNGE